MVRMDGAEARRERINRMARTIQAMFYAKKERGEPEELPLKKTVSKLGIETGLTRQKIMTYLEELADDDQFILDVEHDKIRKAES
jgi:hypothetical protein